MLERTQFSYGPDPERLALVTGAETIAVWHLEADAPAFAVETSRSKLEGVAFVGPNQLLTVHQLGECVIWELPAPEDVPAETENVPQTTGETDGTSARTLEGEAAPSEAWTGEIAVDVCEFAARSETDGYARAAAAGGRNGTVVLFDLSGDEPMLARADAHRGNVTRLAFDPHGYRLASGGRDRRVVLWSTDPETFQPLEKPDTEETSGESADEGADSDDQEASTAPHTRDPLSDRQLHRLNVLEGSRGWPLAIAFSHDETKIATTSLDNGLYLWDPAADEPLLGVVNRHDNWVTELEFSPDDTCVATGSWDATVHVFETQSLAPRFRFDGHSDFVSSVAFVPESDLLVSTGYDGRLEIWNWREGSLLHDIQAHPDWIEALVVLDGKRGLTLSSEEVVRLWDLENGDKLAELGDTTFEGFELGREVDFSKYVDVPALSSDELADSRRPVPSVDAVQRLDGKQGELASGATGQTAVGLLEDAIGEPASVSTGHLEETSGDSTRNETAGLESQIDDPALDPLTDDSPTGSDDSKKGVNGTDETSESSDKVDAAFVEISDAESSEDEEVQSSIDGVGEAIDEKVSDDEELLGDGASPTLGAPVDEASDSRDSSGEAAPGSPEAESTLQGQPDFAPGGGGGMSMADPNSTLVGTPEKHTSEMSTEEPTSAEETQQGTGVGGRLSTPGELDDFEEADPDDIPDPQADGGSPDRSLGVDDADTDSSPGETVDSDGESSETLEGSSLADEPTDELAAIDTTAKEEEVDERPQTEKQQTSDEGELKSKLEKLRDNKQSAAPDPAPAETLQVGMANIWEARPAPLSDRSSTSPLEAADETTSSAEFQLRGAFLTAHERVDAIAPHPQSDLVASCGTGDRVGIWTFDGQHRLTLTTDGDDLHDIALTPDGRCLIAAADGGRIYLWLLPPSLQERENPIPYACLNEHDARVNGLDLEPTGTFLISGSEDGAARIWSLVDGACMAELDGHEGAIRDVSWGQFPVSAGSDGSVRYWDDEGRMINESSGFDAVTSVATLGTRTGWATESGHLHLQSASKPRQLQTGDEAARAVDFGSDKTFVAVGGEGRVELFADEEKTPVQTIDGDTPLSSVCMRRNVLAAGGEDGRIYLYSRG